MGVRLGKETDEQEMTVGTEHVAFAHKLVHLVARGVGDFVTVLDDVVGDVDGMVVVAPHEVAGGG